MRIFVVTDNMWWFEKLRQFYDERDEYVDIYCSPAGASIFEENINRRLITPLNLSEESERLVAHYDVGISAHCKQIFPEKLVEEIRCVNIHPGMNPCNRGWYPQVFSILNKQPWGATIHVMDSQIDHGPIVVQQEIKIQPWDTSLTAYMRVLDLEYELFVSNYESILSGCNDRNSADEGNYNSIADYRALCELDLDQRLTLREAIDLLRALTHPPFRNAYFIEKDGSKIFCSLELYKDS